VRIAERVLRACGERVGLLTNGVELRIVLSNPTHSHDSEIVIPIDPHWKRSRDVPDSYLLLLALCSPAGVKAIPDLIEKARLQQTRVTRELRVQARQAIGGFVQEVLDHPANREALAACSDRQKFARDLWYEGLGFSKINMLNTFNMMNTVFATFRYNGPKVQAKSIGSVSQCDLRRLPMECPRRSHKTPLAPETARRSRQP
jgi:hypothetical protein